MIKETLHSKQGWKHTNKISTRSNIFRIPIPRNIGAPVGETFMMLACENEVSIIEKKLRTDIKTYYVLMAWLQQTDKINEKKLSGGVKHGCKPGYKPVCSNSSIILLQYTRM